jgi:hypothetical protein
MTRLVLSAAAALFLLSSAAYAEESCKSAGAPLTKAEVEKKLNEQGYVQVRGLELHDGCYEAKGIDKDGKRFELEIDAHTGEVVAKE